MAQKGSNPPPSAGRPAPPPNPPRPGAAKAGSPWLNAYLHPPTRVGVYWCAYENGGCWLGYFIGNRWETHASLKGDDDMGPVEFYLDLPRHPFADERSKQWHERDVG